MANAEWLDVVENLRGAEADVRRLFGAEEGVRVQNTARPDMIERGLDFLDAIERGKRPLQHFKEAMSTSDFPILFADILDRKMLGYYTEWLPVYQQFIGEDTVNDFKTVKRFAQDGLEGVLPAVDELEEYPEDSLEESKDEYSVHKRGKRVGLSWESWVNDDFNNFLRIPERLARAARRTEQRIATELYIDTKGPHAALYTAGFKNVVTGNPKLSINALQTALIQLAEAKDNDGEPIVQEALKLVIPPALEVTAMNIINALTIDVNENGGTEKSRLRAQNWMQNKLQIVVDPYIPIVANKENANTSWALFGDPNLGRPAVILGKLRGYEEPSLYEKVPTARRVGGGGEVAESFHNDDRQWRIRHVRGGVQLLSTGGPKATIASNGSGA